MTATDFANRFRTELQEALDGLDLQTLSAVVDTLERACAEERAVYVMGNGGSGATASHFTSDVAAAVVGTRGLRITCLNDNVPRLTALANDVGYEAVFQQQIVHAARPGDVVVLFSASGDSENILRAARAAREAEATVIALLGFGGGRARALADLDVTCASRDYAVVESFHSAVEHLVAGWLRRRLRGQERREAGR